MARINDLFRKTKGGDKRQNAAPGKEEAKKKRGRRYSFLVEEIEEMTRLDGILVQGTIHGKLRKGDTMYLYQMNTPAREVHVISMELRPGETVEEAKNQRAGLILDLDSAEKVSRFAVLSSVKPLEGELANRVIENPRLFGLMMEYRQRYTDSAYMDALLYELCQAKLIVPLYMDRPPMPQADGTLAFEKDAFVGFRSLKMPDDETQTVFPAFTDEVAAMAWKDAFQEGQPKRYATMQLPHLINYVRKGHAGLMVNPFGPVAVYFPKELLQQVENSEVFRSKFVRPDAVRKPQEGEPQSTEAK